MSHLIICFGVFFFNVVVILLKQIVTYNMRTPLQDVSIHCRMLLDCCSVAPRYENSCEALVILVAEIRACRPNPYAHIRKQKCVWRFRTRNHAEEKWNSCVRTVNRHTHTLAKPSWGCATKHTAVMCTTYGVCICVFKHVRTDTFRDIFYFYGVSPSSNVYGWLGAVGELLSVQMFHFANSERQQISK